MTSSNATWDELDSNQPCPACGCIDNGHVCDDMSATEALMSVEGIEITTQQDKLEMIAVGLKHGVILTTTIVSGCYVTTAEDAYGEPHTVIGDEDSTMVDVMFDALAGLMQAS
jgi:hypothetical protein